MLKSFWKLYYDGFSHLPRWAKVVVAIVAVKLAVMFLVFKMLLMPDYLNSRYATEEEKGAHVLQQFISKP